MARPLLALGLVTLAILLLGSLFASVGEQIEDPDPFSPDAEKLAGAADAAGPHADYLNAVPDAALVKLLEDAEIQIPEDAAMWDGEALELLQDLEWTLPAGTELEDVALPIPPGTTMQLPEGTWVRDDTLVFPPGSDLVLADGTTLHLPEGGALRVPDARSADLQRAVAAGHFTVPESGAIFTAPRVTSNEDWPLLLPAGTRIPIPEGWDGMPEGTVPPGDYRFPEGMTFEPRTEHDSGSEDATSGSSLIERIGQMDLTQRPDDPDPDPQQNGATAPRIPEGTLWYGLIGALAAAVVTWFVWRHRRRLLALIPATTPPAPTAHATQHPFRLITRIDDRPEALPLAVAPMAPRTLHLRIEAKTRTEDGIVWTPTEAEVRIELAGERLYDDTITADGTTLPLPGLVTGARRLALQVQIPGHKRVRISETVRVAPWAEQVACDYDRLAVAVQAHTRLPDGFTPRRLEQEVAPLLPLAAHLPLSRALTTFERANYSQSEIDEASWLRMAEIVQRLIRTLDAPKDPPDPPSAAPVLPSETDGT